MPSKTGKGQNNVSNSRHWPKRWGLCLLPKAERGLWKQTSKGLLCFEYFKRVDSNPERCVHYKGYFILLTSQCCIQVSSWVNLGYEGAKMLMWVGNLCLLSVAYFLTCIWSPASTMRVLLLARAKGIMVSHSMAWAASSSSIWVNNPTETDISFHINDTRWWRTFSRI